ncbi:MAG: class I SAM-dependent methyltransferase [Blastocatellia bacterium]
MTDTSHYLHGTTSEEQSRLSLLNDLLNVRSLAEMQLAQEQRILDVGSGLGQLTRAMARASGANVVGIERSHEQMHEAARQAAAAGENALVEFRQGDAHRLPLQEAEWGSFDLVHTRFLLEHVPDPLVIVQAMVRAARPGGRIILEDDDHDLLRLWPEVEGFAALWQAYMRSYEHLGNDPIVGRRLVALLAAAGAQPVRNTLIFFGSCAGEPNFAGFCANLIEVIASARATVTAANLLDAVAFDAALANLRGWSQRPDAAIWYAMSWAEGKKTEQRITERND